MDGCTVVWSLLAWMPTHVNMQTCSTFSVAPLGNPNRCGHAFYTCKRHCNEIFHVLVIVLIAASAFSALAFRSRLLFQHISLFVSCQAVPGASSLCTKSVLYRAVEGDVSLTLFSSMRLTAAPAQTLMENPACSVLVAVSLSVTCSVKYRSWALFCQIFFNYF